MTAGFVGAGSSSGDGGSTEDVSLQSALFDIVCDGLSSAFIIYDKNDAMVYASRQVMNFLPVPKDVLRPGTRLRDFLSAVYDTGIRQQHTAGKPLIAVSKEDWVSERIASHWRERYEATERHGADRWIRFVKRRLSSGFGLCVISDVSEDKKREEQWRADLERVQLTEDILDNLPFPLFVKDRNLTYVAVNKAFCDSYQTSPDEVLGRKSPELFAPDMAARFEESDRHVMETGEMSVTRQRRISREGVEGETITRKHRIGKPGRYFLVSTMQDLPKAGDEFQEFGQASSLQVSNSFKRAYVPMSAFNSPKRNPIASEAFVPENFSGRKILVVTADIAAETSALKTLGRYGFEACAVHSDEEQKAFLEIAAAGGLKLDLLVVDNQMSMRCLELAEGAGIPALVLDSFQMANELTFLIARHFNRNKTDHAVEVELDIGSDADWPGRADDGGQLQVLVAEDNDINQIVFSQILEGLGYRYRIAASGDEVVQMWTEYRPEIVLMDISLPGFNGFEAARLIRKLEEDGGKVPTPIIGVLTQAFERDRAECVKSGMDDIIMKPVSPDILEAIFKKHIKAEGARLAAR